MRSDGFRPHQAVQRERCRPATDVPTRVHLWLSVASVYAELLACENHGICEGLPLSVGEFLTTFLPPDPLHGRWHAVFECLDSD
jgi:hypothetical protein